MKFKDKVALVTGASSGIGRATAIKFAGEGARVVVNYRSNPHGAQEVVGEIEKLGGEAIPVQANVADPAQVEALFAKTLEAFGGLDILINNAGSTVGKPFLEMTKEDWLSSFDDNFFGAVLCSQQAAKIMLKKGGGKIITTGSIRGLGHTGRAGIMAYSAAKAALINFTKTLAKELAPKITVNIVAPGFVYTPSYDDMPQETVDGFIGGTLIKRFIEADEIADAFLFLAGAEAITGEVLIVDGGFTLK